MERSFKTVDEYISSFPVEVRILLKNMRSIILETAPEAEESLSYGMAAYKTFGRPLVYFAGFKKHIGFYATPTGHSEFEEELSKYKRGKGSVQFPVSETLPVDLVRRITKFRLKENEARYSK